jgi:hypothetical protein
MNYQALYFSPMIPSFRLSETVRFFTEVLGFSIEMNTETYAIVQKNNRTVHILKAGASIGEMECYLEIDQIDSVWAEIKSKVVDLAVRGPLDREYGMREIHIGIPHTKTLLFLGQEIKE